MSVTQSHDPGFSKMCVTHHHKIPISQNPNLTKSQSHNLGFSKCVSHNLIIVNSQLTFIACGRRKDLRGTALRILNGNESAWRTRGPSKKPNELRSRRNGTVFMVPWRPMTAIHFGSHGARCTPKTKVISLRWWTVSRRKTPYLNPFDKVLNQMHVQITLQK